MPAAPSTRPTSSEPGAHLDPHDVATLVSSALYGTISVTTVITLLDEDAETPGDYLLRAGSAALVLWLAHVYSHWLGGGIAHPATGRTRLWRDAWLSAPIALVAIPLLIPIALAETGIWSLDTGSQISAVVTIAVLLGAGLVLGLRRGVGVGAVAWIVLRCGLLGLLIIVLEESVH